MKSILLYNLYPKNNWQEVTLNLLRNIPHQTIAVNISLDWHDQVFNKKKIISFLQSIPKVDQVFIAKNIPAVAEGIGLENFRRQIDFTDFSLVTYMHSKGVTKPANICIKDWVELMRYFQIDRFDLCQQVFREGYGLYGVNLGKYTEGERYGPFRFSDFHYSGNFVSVNLASLRDVFLTTPVDADYYGVEGFWGKLCPYQQAYEAHVSSPTITNHYTERYPASLYKI
jgi:hypothetical protein